MRHGNSNCSHAVFVYGILKTPENAVSPPDAVAGTLHVNGIALGKFNARSPNVIRGEVRYIDSETLHQWDGIEGVNHDDPARGMYRRIVVVTKDGIEAFAYHYNGSVRGTPILKDGVWTRSYR